MPPLTALMWCAGEIGKVRLLIEKGADVNTTSKLGRTPLLIVASNAFLAIDVRAGS